MRVDDFGRFLLAGNCVEMDVKKKRITAKVQIPKHESVEVLLSQHCSSLAEHAGFLQEKINRSQGELLGLELNGQVKLTAIFADNTALMDHDLQLDEASQYTFRFKLVDGTEDDGLGQSENGPNQMEELANRMAQLAEEKDGLEKQVKKQTETMESQQKLVKALEEEVARVEKELKQLAAQNNTLDELVRKLEEKVKLGEEKEQAAEYARVIGMPTVVNLMKGNYKREKLLHLLKHGNDIGPKLYIQENQGLMDVGLLQTIVDLLAGAEKPEKLIGEVTIESGGYCPDWPQNAELQLKERKSNVNIKFNEASESPETDSGYYFAGYELANKNSRFQVLLYYWPEGSFNKCAEKFVYRRLD